ncbi:MAG: helix-turn-helix transcriptional regulator [Firmicutes bacterium]|nr:helix-turn-helix transcriptional regulator [Bacillota bacterium]
MISDRIKKLREKNNITQADLAKAIGVTTSAVSAWEKGVNEPRMGAVHKIAQYFNVTKSYLVNDEDSPIYDQQAIMIAETLIKYENQDLAQLMKKISKMDKKEKDKIIKIIQTLVNED